MASKFGDLFSGKNKWVGKQSNQLEEFQAILEDKGGCLDQKLGDRKLLEKLRKEWTRKRSEQQRRIWAREVYNRFYSSDTGIRCQLMALEEFLDVQLDDEETPQVTKKMIQSNYLGNLEFICSKLPPPLERAEEAAVEMDEEIREEQLEFLGWKPLRMRIQILRRQLEAQRRKLSDAKNFQRREEYEEYKSKYEQEMKEFAVDKKITQIQKDLEENLKRVEEWQEESKPYDIGFEQNLFERITALMGSELFVRLRDPEITPDELLMGSREFLKEAHRQLLDPFARPEDN